MELRNLKTFITIAKLQSFSRTADLLGYAQSTVTAQIQALEEELGTQLFERFGRSIKLTRDGENLFWYAEQILKLADAARTTAFAEERPRGPLSIGTPESFCIHCLPDLLKEYRQLYPAVEIKLHFGTCCDLHAMLQHNQLDIAFILDEAIVDDDLITIPLFKEPVILLASPRHPLAAKAAVGPRDLDGEAFILTETGCSWRTRLEEIMAAHKVRPFPAMEVSNVEIIKRFARDNLGLTILSRFAVTEEIASGELAALSWDGPLFTVMAQLIYHKQKWLSPALKTFIDLAETRFKAGDDRESE